MPKTVLVVDDQMTIRQMLRFALQLQDYRILEAQDGAEALEILNAETVDLLVTDWKMPRMDGLELVRKLRQNNNLAETPVIIVSCETNPQAQVEAKQNGVSHWLKKPFRMAEIQLLVANTLHAALVTAKN